MYRVVLLAAAIMVAMASGEARAGMAEDVTAAIERQWSEAFARGDWAALAGLYAPGALFYGSKPQLFQGPEGVRAYLAGLPKGVLKEALFADQVAALMANNVVVAAGSMTFSGSQNGKPVVQPMRVSLVFQKSKAGKWQIISHHAEPRGAGIAAKP